MQCRDEDCHHLSRWFFPTLALEFAFSGGDCSIWLNKQGSAQVYKITRIFFKKKKTHDENANSAQRPIQMRQLNTCGTSNAQSLPFMQTEVSS